MTTRGCCALIKKENTRITVTISKKLYDKLAEEADYEDRSVSNMAATILKMHYKNKPKREKEK